ncbi:MAG: hypothetical protein QM715_10185 [Nibricoccus sp.]
MLLLLAAAAERVTPLEKLQNVSGQFWIKVILGIVILSLLIFLFRKVAGMNKIILVIVLAVVFGVIGFNWIYNRNEPKALTPLVDILAQWFPTKGSYDDKQQQDATKPGVRKNPAPSKSAPTTTQPAK